MDRITVIVVETQPGVGVPGYESTAWFGLVMPAGTPKEIVDKLSIEIARIMALPEMKEKLVSQALEPFVSTPGQFAAMMKANAARYAEIIKTSNIKIE